MKTKHHGQMSESFLTAVFLSLSGGLQDAYTYLFRGKVFANAQTGNIVLLSATPCSKSSLRPLPGWCWKAGALLLRCARTSIAPPTCGIRGFRWRWR